MRWNEIKTTIESAMLKTNAELEANGAKPHNPTIKSVTVKTRGGSNEGVDLYIMYAIDGAPTVVIE